MNRLFINILLLLLWQTKFLGQPKTAVQFSPETQKILDSLHCNLCTNSTDLEFRTIGEASKISPTFLIYAELTKVATEKELLDILANSKELSFIRGYAYMAYVYKCEIEKKKEKVFNYKFNIDVRSGCVKSPYSFPEFKTKIHGARRPYDPYPRYTVIENEEKKAIELENKIRKEQGENLRKE